MIIFKEIIGYNNNSIHPKLDEFLEKVSQRNVIYLQENYQILSLIY